MYAEVVFPFPFRNSFTYRVPGELEDSVQAGIRVVAPFGKRILTGFVISTPETCELPDKIKEIRDVLDKYPIFDENSLKFYQWIADYYLSSLGEALRNCVPAGLDVETKRKIVADTAYCFELYNEEPKKNTIKAQLLQLLSVNEITKMSFLQKTLKKKNIYSALRSLERIGAISIVDELENAKVRIKYIKHVRLAQSKDKIFNNIPLIEKRSPKQVVILLHLVSLKEESVSLAGLLKKTNTNASSVNSLAEKGLVEIFDKEVTRNYKETFEEAKENFTLTPAQQKVITSVTEKIDEQKFKPYLLHGVTGSGKTQVYIELVKLALTQGKNALILVPEISLTPQMTTRLLNHFGDEVAVLHSKMSAGERFDSWRSVLSGKSRVVVGARSALFSPLKNLGLIVVDEEHDQSYKNHETVPKYHARDAAVVLAQMNSCPVILGSATPSIESMHNAENGKYDLLELKERVDNAQLPEIKLVNVNIEKKKHRMENIFSKTLLEEIKKRIEKKEGVIILQNRRGFATQVYCEDCGEIQMCSECSVPMVHHISKNILVCHYCGNSMPVPKGCTNCGSLSIKFFGTGTQRVEDELDFYFPEIRMERVDSDALNKKGKLASIFNDFKKGELDLLVGTQIVAKGLDFSKVTLVGVIAAETSLWMPDFRADERTFQLLTQVAGRAGRSKEKGEVIIQTQDHENFVLKKVVMNDYEGMYKREIGMREEMSYPPFARICLIEAKDEKEENVHGAMKDFYQILTRYSNYVTVYPPTEAIIAKIKGQYRYQILVKSLRKTDSGGAVLRKAILDSFIEFNEKSRYRNIKLYFDIDPQNIM